MIPRFFADNALQGFLSCSFGFFQSQILFILTQHLRKNRAVVFKITIFYLLFAHSIYRVSRVLHCDIAALGGKQPEQGCKLGIDEDGFVRSYYVASSVCEMGMLRVELEAIDE